MSFNGKRVLVTGGSRGIGRGIVEALYKEGAEVFALGKQKENLDKLKADLPNVNIVQADLENWDATREAVEGIKNIDLLVNNAAIVDDFTPFIDCEKNVVDKLFDINLKAHFNISQIVARDMIKRGCGGAFVNMSSVASLFNVKGLGAGCIMKAGLDMLTKVMALELGQHKIRVNSLNPTITKTDMVTQLFVDPDLFTPWMERTPLGRFAEIQDVVNATLFLLSEKAAMITGTILPVDGGYLLT